jgi:hypothetical protein
MVGVGDDDAVICHGTYPAPPRNLRMCGAIALRWLGKLEEAESENRAVLALSLLDLGPEHPSTLQSREKLAFLLYKLGRINQPLPTRHVGQRQCDDHEVDLVVCNRQFVQVALAGGAAGHLGPGQGEHLG